MTREPIFLIDKFDVPPAAEAEFLRRIRATHALLSKQPGCLLNLVLRQTGGPGTFNFVTLVSWDSQEAIDRARLALITAQAADKFEQGGFLERLRVKADIATYRALDLALIPAE